MSGWMKCLLTLDAVGRGSRAEYGGGGDGGTACSTGPVGITDDGVTGNESYRRVVAGGDTIEGRV